MNYLEISSFLEKNQQIRCKLMAYDGFGLFRNESLIWYQKDPDRATEIAPEALFWIEDGQELMEYINRGLQVEQMTRVTGYMSKISQWNKGKRAELKDRFRNSQYFDGEGCMSHFVPHT